MIDLNFTMVIQLVIVLTLILFLSRLAFRPYMSVLQKRKERVEGAESISRELMQRAEELMLKYREGISMAQAKGSALWEEIRKEGLTQEVEIMQKATSEANQSIEEMKKRIAEESKTARAFLRQEAETLSREVAEKILGRSLS